MSREPWWKNGLCFECQGSGKCCSSRGEHGYVYLTLKERKILSDHFSLSLVEFDNKYCQLTDELYHLKNKANNCDCIFLKNKKCSIYDKRPFQCRTWPFWPENLSSKKNWVVDVEQFCPGANKGKKHDAAAIQKILNEHQQWDDDLVL